MVPGFEQCVGFLDSTCSEIRRPKENQDLYYRGDKAYHNILNQLVVDPLGRNIHLTFGGQGSRNDRGFFNESVLYSNQNEHFSPGEYLIADGGFRGNGSVVCPFNRNEVRGEDRNNRARFNQNLRSSRVTVEWGFGFIHNKWEIFNRRWKYEKDEIGITLYVACLLANRYFRIRRTLITSETLLKRYERYEARIED
jgi:hypothetical protein